jgi:hypothetical protein
VGPRPGRYRGWSSLQAAPGGTIRLTDHQQLVDEFRQSREKRDADRTGAQEGDPPEPGH